MNLFGYEIPVNLIIIAFGVVFGLIFIFTLIALIISVKANKKMKRLLRDNNGTDIKESVIDYYEKCRRIEETFKSTQDRLNFLEAESGACIKKVGTIRYDAFRENHANLSFAVALLDEKDNGFIINGVYARENTTTYLKEIRDGKSLFELSDEEKQALYTAKENYERKTNKI